MRHCCTDSDPCGSCIASGVVCETPELIRTVRLGRFTVRVYDLHHTDRMGKSALGWRITERRTSDHGAKARGHVVSQCLAYDQAVYASPYHAIDSDSSVASLVALVCHAAQHDDQDEPCDPGWDAAELDEELALRWPDL